MITSVVMCGILLDAYLARKSADGSPKPEYHLPPMVLGIVLIPIRILGFGWSEGYHLHWIVPIGSTALSRLCLCFSRARHGQLPH